VRAAANHGIQVLAVTDHDTVAGLDAAREEAEVQGVEFIAGVELSVTLAGDEIHLLAYDFDPTDDALRAHLEEMRAARRQRAWDMVARLRAQGLAIADEHLEAQLGDTTAVGRPHVAAALMAAGHVSTIREAFESYLGDDGPGGVEKPRVRATDALVLIHEAGGVGVLAHPGHWTSSSQIRTLIEKGLDGIELHHPSHRSSLVSYYRRWAAGRDLLLTGGSDYHGRGPSQDQHLGTVGLSKGEWERFRAALT
jgi:predicted metal-dependent phosphoesterase TrpH